MALAACGAIALGTGCGSSGSSSSSSNHGGGESTSASTGGFKKTGKPKYGAVSPNTAVQSGTVDVAYRNIAIFPGKLRVTAGTTVSWTNYDSVEHNVTSEGGPQKIESKNFGEGATFKVTLTKPGVIHYLCTIHPASMNGTIEVVK